jgi:hypothetical protein
LNYTDENSNGTLTIQPDFYRTLAEIKESRFTFDTTPISKDVDFEPFIFPEGKSKLSALEDLKSYSLNAENGHNQLKKDRLISGYDESMNTYLALEGESHLTVHSIVTHGERDYIPNTMVSYYFYTKAKKYAEGKKSIRYSTEIEGDSNRDYALDRLYFLMDKVKPHSIVFIDGPLIGGQISEYTRQMNSGLLKKDIIPIFFVKNSNSNLITDNLESLKGQYNSDMDWAQKTIKFGERTSWFRYIDQDNQKNGKIFCYFKTSNLTVQRIEIHIETYFKYSSDLNDLIDLSYYLLRVQGSVINPQIRTIAIAEKYAREILNLVKRNKIIFGGLTPTMNTIRFQEVF